MHTLQTADDTNFINFSELNFAYFNLSNFLCSEWKLLFAKVVDYKFTYQYISTCFMQIAEKAYIKSSGVLNCEKQTVKMNP